MASKQGIDRFRRGEKRQGGQHGTYTKNVSRNAAIKGKAVLNQTIIDILFCLLVPPYGLYRVWTQDKVQPVFKIVCTLAAALIMFLWFLLIIPDQQPEPQQVVRTRPVAIQE